MGRPRWFPQAPPRDWFPQNPSPRLVPPELDDPIGSPRCAPHFKLCFYDVAFEIENLNLDFEFAILVCMLKMHVDLSF